MTSRPIYYVDACVLIRAQDAGRATLNEVIASCEQIEVRLASGVLGELRGVPPDIPMPVQREMGDALANRLEVVEVRLLTPEGAVFRHLRGNRTTQADLGECESIALASVEPSAVFVTDEKGAAWMGVVELEGRVLGLAAFLSILVREGDLSAVAADRVLANSNTRAPSWWSPRFGPRGAGD